MAGSFARVTGDDCQIRAVTGSAISWRARTRHSLARRSLNAVDGGREDVAAEFWDTVGTNLRRQGQEPERS